MPQNLVCACGRKKHHSATQCFACRNPKSKTAATAAPVKPAAAAELTDSRIETATALSLTRILGRVVTLQQLCELCEVDLSVWEVDRFECNKWEMGSKDALDRPQVTPLFQVKAIFKRRSVQERTLELLAQTLVEDIRREVAKGPELWTPDQRFVKDGFCFEFPPFDLHLGKFAWGKETVADYDVQHAEDLYNSALDYLLTNAMKLSGGNLSRILCVFGNDVSHVDSKKLQTTGGTQMDYDSRYIKVYRRIFETHRRAVNILRSIAPVKIVIVPGNHDEQTSFHLGTLLEATYERDKHIKIDNGPRLRKYDEWGVNLLGFAHGDKERVGELPLTMAREQKDAWARCTEREWQIGHKHIVEGWETRRGRKTHYTDDRPGLLEQDLYSDKGVRIRRLTSLSGHDAWHTMHAYMDRRACEGFLYHSSAGFTGQLSFNVEHFTGKPMTTGEGA
jgi:hypothetical protein